MTRKKGAVRTGRGAMCNICGVNCGTGGALKKHVESKHAVSYEAYKRCFYLDGNEVFVDSWADEIAVTDGEEKEMLSGSVHTLVRYMNIEPGKRGVRKAG